MIPSSDCTRGYSIHLTQNIGIISNTSSQGELSYRASSLHVAFMTAQKVTLTIPWCRAKWNYRQRESTTQRLCENHALTSARLGGQKVEEFITTLEKSLPQPLYWKSPRQIELLQGLQSMDQPCPTSARSKTNLQTVRGACRDNNSSNRRKEKMVNWIKYLPKWTKSTGSTGST